MSKQYEYRTEEITDMSEYQSTLTTDSKICVYDLNEMSKEGWNLVCTTSTQLIFKKEVNQ